MLEIKSRGNGSSGAQRAVVIGSGFGGLAAAVRLGSCGYDVTVLERRDRPGGRAYVVEQDGFVFDTGPTLVTAPQLFEELWELCGERMSDHIDMRPLDPFYAVRFDDGTLFLQRGDADAARSEIAKLSPEDVAGYERFLAMSERIFHVGYEDLADVPFLTWGSMVRIIPSMVRLKGYRTVHGLVSAYVKSEKVRQVLSFNPLLIGGNPFSTTSIYALIAHLERRWGVHYPMGGMGTLVDGLVRLLTAQGADLRLNTQVDEITIEAGRATGVRLRSGEHIPASIVVSNADAAWTYRYLVPSPWRRRWTDSRIDKARYSMGLFVWHFGTARQYPDVHHHTILLGPRYRSLLGDIFDRKVLADDFSLYLHRPTATDPSMAPAGCDSFYALSPVPHLTEGIDWQKQAEPYRRSIEQFLGKTVLPGLSQSIVTSRMVTPRDFHRDLLAFRGAGFAMQPVLTQSAYFRPHNTSEDVNGLYLVGAGTHPGAGLPGVLNSAKVLDRVVPRAA